MLAFKSIHNENFPQYPRTLRPTRGNEVTLRYETGCSEKLFTGKASLKAVDYKTIYQKGYVSVLNIMNFVANLSKFFSFLEYRVSLLVVSSVSALSVSPTWVGCCRLGFVLIQHLLHSVFLAVCLSCCVLSVYLVAYCLSILLPIVCLSCCVLSVCLVAYCLSVLLRIVCLSCCLLSVYLVAYCLSVSWKYSPVYLQDLTKVSSEVWR